jgi:hypothetical protein
MPDEPLLALAAKGQLSKPATLLGLYDVEAGLGGPIKKDKLWFFYTGRTFGSSTSVTGMFFNKNAGDPTKWTYDPDPSLQGRTDASTIVNNLRLTYQINQRSKFSLFADYQKACNGAVWINSSAKGCRPNPDGWAEGGTSTIATEGWRAPRRRSALAGHLYQHADLRMLFEFSYSVQQPLGRVAAPEIRTSDLIQVREQGGLIPLPALDQHAGRHRLPTSTG